MAAPEVNGTSFPESLSELQGLGSSLGDLLAEHIGDSWLGDMVGGGAMGALLGATAGPGGGAAEAGGGAGGRARLCIPTREKRAFVTYFRCATSANLSAQKSPPLHLSYCRRNRVALWCESPPPKSYSPRPRPPPKFIRPPPRAVGRPSGGWRCVCWRSLCGPTAATAPTWSSCTPPRSALGCRRPSPPTVSPLASFNPLSLVAPRGKKKPWPVLVGSPHPSLPVHVHTDALLAPPFVNACARAWQGC